MNINQRSLFMVVVAVSVAILACSPIGGGAATKSTQAPPASAAPQAGASTAAVATVNAAATAGAAAPGGEATATSTYDTLAAQLTVPPLLTAKAATAATAAAANGALRQWAAAAKASSQYGDTDWSASQATGAPNSAAGCGDQKTAWASADNAGADNNLELVYTTTVVPVAVNIYENNGPGSIIKVDVVEAGGAAHTIYTAEPLPTDQCPRTLSIGITGLAAHVNRVKIYVDQSVVKTWDEIDAVELVGNP